jgi:hypothetical protein
VLRFVHLARLISFRTYSTVSISVKLWHGGQPIGFKGSMVYTSNSHFLLLILSDTRNSLLVEMMPLTMALSRSSMWAANRRCRSWMWPCMLMNYVEGGGSTVGERNNILEEGAQAAHLKWGVRIWNNVMLSSKYTWDIRNTHHGRFCFVQGNSYYKVSFLTFYKLHFRSSYLKDFILIVK